MVNYQYPECPPFTHPLNGGWTQREQPITPNVRTYPAEKQEKQNVPAASE